MARQEVSDCFHWPCWTKFAATWQHSAIHHAWLANRYLLCAYNMLIVYTLLVLVLCMTVIICELLTVKTAINADKHCNTCTQVWHVRSKSILVFDRPQIPQIAAMHIHACIFYIEDNFFPAISTMSVRCDLDTLFLIAWRFRVVKVIVSYEIPWDKQWCWCRSANTKEQQSLEGSRNKEHMNSTPLIWLKQPICLFCIS